MPGTAAQQRIEKKNLKKRPGKTEADPALELPVPKPKKEKERYCLTCKQFQKNPTGYCKFHKEYRPRKQKACEVYDPR
jgi:hypothetical protein